MWGWEWRSEPALRPTLIPTGVSSPAAHCLWGLWAGGDEEETGQGVQEFPEEVSSTVQQRCYRNSSFPSYCTYLPFSLNPSGFVIPPSTDPKLNTFKEVSILAHLIPLTFFSQEQKSYSHLSDWISPFVFLISKTRSLDFTYLYLSHYSCVCPWMYSTVCCVKVMHLPDLNSPSQITDTCRRAHYCRG